MDIPAIDAALVPEKKIIEDGKDGGPAFHCDLYDAEIVHKIAQVLLVGLSAACVDNTTGGMFRYPGTVAVEIRKDMIDYLNQRSENFVAESVILEGVPEAELSDNPYDIISDLVDDFASSKRNFFSRVSGWLLSESREDKIDDLVQEMELNGFWLMDRREAIAQTLLKNVDFKNTFHCDKKYSTEEDLNDHVVNCSFRTMNCRNEGCTAIFPARHVENHDSVCPFKIIPCEQKCSDNIMRRGMDRHCITVCPMKLMNCPFYSVGCQSTVPQCKLQQHYEDELRSHLQHLLKTIHKETSMDDLRRRVDQIMQSFPGQLEGARDVRSLNRRVKDIETKLGPLEVTASKKVNSESSVEATMKAVEELSIEGAKNVSDGENNYSEEATDAVGKVDGENTDASILIANRNK